MSITCPTSRISKTTVKSYHTIAVNIFPSNCSLACFDCCSIFPLNTCLFNKTEKETENPFHPIFSSFTIIVYQLEFIVFIFWTNIVACFVSDQRRKRYVRDGRKTARPNPLMFEDCLFDMRVSFVCCCCY